jgi:hypothetical protein
VATPNQGQRPGFVDRRAERFRSAQIPYEQRVAQKTVPNTLLRGGWGIRRNMLENPAFSGFQPLTLPIFLF